MPLGRCSAPSAAFCGLGPPDPRNGVQSLGLAESLSLQGKAKAVQLRRTAGSLAEAEPVGHRGNRAAGCVAWLQLSAQ